MTDMEVVDTSSPKQLRDAIRKSKDKDAVAKEGLKMVMGDVAGRAWLYRVLMLCDPFRNPFSTDPLMMAQRCGEVNIGLQLIAEMDEASPDLYLQMMKENKNG
jgi:hypothetical protein